MSDLEALVRQCVASHTPEELALGWLRYEALRRLTPLQFNRLHVENLKGTFFDDLVTEELLQWQWER